MDNGAAAARCGVIVPKCAGGNGAVFASLPEFYRAGLVGEIAVKQGTGDVEAAGAVDSAAEFVPAVVVDGGGIAGKAAVDDRQGRGVSRRVDGAALRRFVFGERRALNQRFSRRMDGAAVHRRGNVIVKGGVFYVEAAAAVDRAARTGCAVAGKRRVAYVNQTCPAGAENRAAGVRMVVFKPAAVLNVQVAGIKNPRSVIVVSLFENDAAYRQVLPVAAARRSVDDGGRISGGKRQGIKG